MNVQCSCPILQNIKNNSKKNNLNIRGQHRKDIRENIEANPHDLALQQWFLSLKREVTGTSILKIIKVKISLLLEVNNKKIQWKQWKRVCAEHFSEGLQMTKMLKKKLSIISRWGNASHRHTSYYLTALGQLNSNQNHGRHMLVKYMENGKLHIAGEDLRPFGGFWGVKYGLVIWLDNSVSAWILCRNEVAWYQTVSIADRQRAPTCHLEGRDDWAVCMSFCFGLWKSHLSLELDRSEIAQYHDCNECYWIVHFKVANFMLHDLYLNKSRDFTYSSFICMYPLT